MEDLAEQGTDLGGYRKMSKSVSKVYISNFTSKSIFKKLIKTEIFILTAYFISRANSER